MQQNFDFIENLPSLMSKKLSKIVGILQNKPQRLLISGMCFISFFFPVCLQFFWLAVCLLFRTCDEKCLVPDEFGDEIMLSVDMGLYLEFQTKKEWGGMHKLFT